MPQAPSQPKKRVHAERYGRYILLDRIDVGGMAEVFRGRMGGVEGFERMVALKRILPNIAADPDFVEMFVNEAKLAVQLQHANIAQIYELGKVGKSHFIAMEYISGVSLRTMWDRARGRNRLLPIAMSCYILQKVCEGLDAAHRKKDGITGDPIGLVHRDVSPQNVLVSFEGEVKVIDFGIAKAANKISKTQAGVLKGKFGYMSPEQVRGVDLDNRSDIFACGVILHELLVGDRLFIGESDFSTLEKIRSGDVVPPTQLNKNLSSKLEAIVMKALTRDRDGRYRWAGEMAEHLQRYLFSTNQPFARTDLQKYMQQHFRSEIEAEKGRLESYRDIQLEAEPEPRAPALPPETSQRPSTRVATVSDAPAYLPEAGTESVEKPSLSVVSMPANRLPSWAAGVMGVLATILAVGAVGVALWSQGYFSAPGGLNLTVVPSDAEVLLDGRLIAKGNAMMEGLSPGNYVVTVKRTGFESAVFPVLVEDGQTRMKSIQLERLVGQSKLTVLSDPAGMAIALDGVSTGETTPHAFSDVVEGQHKVVLTRSDGTLVARRTVSVSASSPGKVRVKVAELPASVEVTSIPAGAEIRINGMLRGNAPVTVNEVPPGKMIVDVRAPRCRPKKLQRKVEAGAITQISVALDCL